MARPTPPQDQQPNARPAGPGPFFSNRKNQVTVLGVLIFAWLMAFLILPSVKPAAVVEEKSLSEVLVAIEAGQWQGQPISEARLDDAKRVVVLDIKGTKTHIAAAYPELYGSELVDRLDAAGVKFKTTPVTSPSIFGSLLMTLLPVVLLVGAFMFLMKRSGMGGQAGGGAKAFTNTTAELDNVPDCRFTDVVGCDEAVEELSEVVAFLHDPTPFQAAGARMPRGFLLVGPPGTGKTLLARAVAGESGVPFYTAAGSDFAEMFVGVGAARVRDLFAKAKKTGGIVFLDELDSVGRARNGPGGNGSSEERESTLNALLVEMDGFGKEDNVVVIAATNRPDVLDSALLRAGRFDRQVTVAPPDRRGRTRLLNLYARDRQVDSDVDYVALARRTPGLTGADINNLVNQAALEAARATREIISPADFDEALATVVMGRARKSAIVTERDREVTAWHEGGHTVAALTLADANDPVQVTIVPRGVAGGVTWMGGDDNSFLTRTQALAQLTVAMGGRAAEELLFDGDFTQGASGDLQSATGLAINMVTRWGMSSLGLAAIHPEITGMPLAEKVVGEVDRLLAEALDQARALMTEHQALFNAVVAELLAEDTIDHDRLQTIWSAVKGEAAVAEANAVVEAAEELLHSTIESEEVAPPTPAG